ncbi:MAG: gephyrin-like molybdotransferase Glp [Sphingomonadaceae bacterium]
MSPPIPFDAALARLVALGGPLPPVALPLGAARGLRLAAPLVAGFDQPSADVSAMDGYALRAADWPGPVRLVGESAAGRPFGGSVGPGEAVRIFTGAVVPEGADTVALQEDATVDGGAVRFGGEAPAPGANIRRRGQDFARRAPLLAAGDRLNPARLALLAAAGHDHAIVHRRPRIALVSTGNELVPPGTRPGFGQQVASNGLSVGGLLEAAGAQIEDLGILPDEQAAIARCLDATVADVIVTIGGASVGDHDLVRPALLSLGVEPDFWRVAIRPGKPLMAARLKHKLVIGLPGNPASALVTARLFLLPLVRRLLGDADPKDRPRLIPTATDLAANGPRRHYLRARLLDGAVEAFGAQDSSLMTVLAAADALLMREIGAPAVPAGTPVPVLDLWPADGGG